MIETLLEKNDNFQIIGAKIADILKTEIENQKQLAIDAGKDSSLFDVKVFYERSNPFEEYLNNESFTTPLVNVWIEGMTFDRSASNEIAFQKSESTYHVDVYAVGDGYGDGGGDGDGGG